MSAVDVTKLHTFTGHKDCVYTICSSGVDNLFFSGAGDGKVVLWDLANPGEGEQIAQLPNSIYALHLWPKDNLLVAGHNYDGIHLLDWQNKTQLSSLQLTTTAIFDIQSHGDDLLVATGEGTVFVVDGPSLTIKERIAASQRNARTIAVNPLTRELAVGYSDNFIRVFDLGDYSLKKEWAAHANSVFTLQYTPDGLTLLSGSRDARLKAWNVADDYGLREQVVAHLFAINNVAFSPDRKHFVTCSLDKTIKVWDATELKLLKVIDKARHAGHGTSINKLLWTSFNNQVVSASDDRTISVWELFFKL